MKMILEMARHLKEQHSKKNFNPSPKEQKSEEKAPSRIEKENQDMSSKNESEHIFQDVVRPSKFGMKNIPASFFPLEDQKPEDFSSTSQELKTSSMDLNLNNGVKKPLQSKKKNLKLELLENYLSKVESCLSSDEMDFQTGLLDKDKGNIKVEDC